MRVTTALVVSGGGFQGLALLKGLRLLPELRVLLADSFEENVGRFAAHGFHRAPLLADHVAFAHFLRTLCDEQGVEAVFPATDLELDTLVRVRPALESRGTRVWVSSPEVLAMARDKRCFYAWLARQGLPVLPVFDAPEHASGPGPLIGKPLAGWGGRDIVLLASPGDAASLTPSQRAGMVWQPLLSEFDEYSVDFAVDADQRSSPLFQRRRVRTSGGFAVLCEPSANSLVEEIASRTVTALCAMGARGLLNLQILVTGAQAWVSDLNPRVGTSMPLTLAAGGNPVAFLFGVSAGRQAAGAGNRTVRTLDERLMTRPDLRGVRGVVFDLDDTLFDQKDWIARKLRLLWQAERAWLPPEREFLAATLQILEEGERARLFDVYAARQQLGAARRQALINSYRKALPSACRLYADVRGTLAQLRQRGIRIGLVTDNPPESQRHKIECAEIGDSFDAMLLTGDIGCSKPDREAFEAIAERLHLPAGQLVMVGDNLFRDSIGALDAGFAHAFHIQRAGGFFNFDLSICGELLPTARCTALQGLHELDWYLEITAS